MLILHLMLILYKNTTYLKIDIKLFWYLLILLLSQIVVIQFKNENK